MLHATLATEPYVPATVPTPVVQEDVWRWRLKALSDKDTLAAFRASVATKLRQQPAVSDSEAGQTAMVDAISQSLGGSVGWVLLKGPSIGSATGKANGWYNKKLARRLATKRKLLAKKQKVMESHRATSSTKRAAR